MRVAFFCSCSENVTPMLLSEAELLGALLADDDHEVVYGGATGGCMGAVARGVLSRKGRLIGVVPEMDFMEGLVQEGLTDQRVVPSLSERKIEMLDLSDACIVFPGGLGTLDEALEAMALKGVGRWTKPILFYNFLGIWTPFLEALDLLFQQGLVRQPLAQLVRVLDKPEELRENLIHAV